MTQWSDRLRLTLSANAQVYAQHAGLAWYRSLGTPGIVLFSPSDEADSDADEPDYVSYQLLRNVLAIARHPHRHFRVLLDSRRPDLLREWWTIFGAIRDPAVRSRCGFVLWQELAAACPAPLQEFLVRKYGL